MPCLAWSRARCCPLFSVVGARRIYPPLEDPPLNDALSFSDALSATDAPYHGQVLVSTGARPRVSCHAVPRVAWSRARCCPLFSVVGARRIYPPLEDFCCAPDPTRDLPDDL